MTAHPLAGPGAAADPGEAAEPWLPSDWFLPAEFPAAESRVALARIAALQALRRVAWPWWVLWPWALAWVAFQVGMAGQSWHFFAQGGRLLFASTPGAGLRLYAAHPDLQIGPLALAVSSVFRALGPGNGETTAIAAMSLTGPLMLAAVWRLVPAQERRPRSRLLRSLIHN
jgi:hypothetical protein